MRKENPGHVVRQPEAKCTVSGPSQAGIPRPQGVPMVLLLQNDIVLSVSEQQCPLELEHLNGCRAARSRGQLGVPCDQGSAKFFREHNVCGVIGRKVVA